MTRGRDVYEDSNGVVVHRCAFRAYPEYAAQLSLDMRDKLGVSRDTNMQTTFSIYDGKLYVWREERIGAHDDFIFREVTDPDMLFHCYMAIATQSE